MDYYETKIREGDKVIARTKALSHPQTGAVGYRLNEYVAGLKYSGRYKFLRRVSENYYQGESDLKKSIESLYENIVDGKPVSGVNAPIVRVKLKA